MPKLASDHTTREQRWVVEELIAELKKYRPRDRVVLVLMDVSTGQEREYERFEVIEE